jgi:lipoprotein-anchoring transpeptidase ErfK/SrfK
MQKTPSPSRRDFIKLAGLGLGSLAFAPHPPETIARLPQFPAGDFLGRVAVTPNFYSTELKPQPNENAPALRNVGQDEIVVWLRDVIGTNVAGRTNVRWVQTPDGFIYAADLQPVRNLPNTPRTAVPAGKEGFWVEVTVPYVDLILPQGAVPISPGVKYTLQTNQPLRLYFGQVVWIDQIGAGGDGSVLYRVNEAAPAAAGAPGHGYGYGDLFYADGSAFRPLTDEDVSPINPSVDPNTKKIVVDATPGRQVLSCLEGDTEVYFCRVSTGYGEKFSTPTGDQAVSWKIYSIHMAANTGSDSGYDTMGVPWPVFFNTNAGAAIHGTFWHNDFGVRRSHGCVNVSPEDAKWIFRWTTPALSLDQSEIRLAWPNVGGAYSTSVTVNELKA